MPKKKTAKKKPARKPKSQIPNPKSLSHIIEPLRPLAVPIEKLELDPENARRHGEANVAAIAASLRRYGQRKPIVVNRRNGRIESGNGTLLAAKQLGWTQLAAVWVVDDPAAHHGFSLADNRTAELGDWDAALLDELRAEMQQETPDLADALLLDDLLQKTAAEKRNADAPAAGQDAEPESWQVVIDAGDEETQKKLFEEMKAKGFSCRLLTL